jgi:(p)ppGpp synthase/HD superfamily hydrolase
MFRKPEKLNYDSLYQTAVVLATVAHDRQKRKDGSPYIEHPLRVARALREVGHSDAVVIAAVLHDVLEDDDHYTVSDIGTLFGRDISALVQLLTREKERSYLDYLLCIRPYAEARAIKLADIHDNLVGATGTLKAKYELAKYILEHILERV